MFGIALAVGTVLTFVGIALVGAATSTGSKVQNGDSVFVPPGALSLVDPGNVQDAADLARFMTGFIQASIKVTKVIPTNNGLAIGSVIGLTPPVTFSLANVTRIERDGVQFT